MSEPKGAGRDPDGSANEDFAVLKGRFLAVLNHEIRTPLSGIMGMTDLLMETSLDEEQREYVAAARSCAETLFDVLNATLDYSALTTGRVTLERAEFHLVEVVTAALAEHKYQAESKGLDLHWRFDGHVPETIMGDALRLRQILSHLVSNAVKFTDKGEVELVVVAISRAPGVAGLEFRVRDTGIGIPPSQMESIFDSFRQVDSGLARRYNGLGLGLALAERLTHLMGGLIRAESEVGKGTVFIARIEFPLPEDAEDYAPDAANLAGKRILLVEDNEVAQRIYSHVLRRGSYVVEWAPNGEAALSAAGQASFDLILMDLQMPGLDGIETTRALRQMPAYQKTPIVALTANSADEHRRMCMDVGMQGFMLKPVPSDELLATVARFLS